MKLDYTTSKVLLHVLQIRVECISFEMQCISPKHQKSKALSLSSHLGVTRSQYSYKPCHLFRSTKSISSAKSAIYTAVQTGESLSCITVVNTHRPKHKPTLENAPLCPMEPCQSSVIQDTYYSHACPIYSNNKPQWALESEKAMCESTQNHPRDKLSEVLGDQTLACSWY